MNGSINLPGRYQPLPYIPNRLDVPKGDVLTDLQRGQGEPNYLRKLQMVVPYQNRIKNKAIWPVCHGFSGHSFQHK